MAKPNWKNRSLLNGDNLEFLRNMNSESVDLIATDPPFKRNKDFHFTPESIGNDARFEDRWKWEDHVHEEWLDKLKDDFPEVMNIINGIKNSYGEDMAAFMCFLGVRLIEMRRILKKSGSIYLHCDPTASHYIKTVMDSIFGKSNFRNEIVWCYGKWTNKANIFQRNHDIILSYGKTSETKFVPQYKESDGGEKGYGTNVVNGIRQLLVYDWEKAKEKIDEKNYDKLVDRTNSQGTRMSDWWSDISILNPQAKERVRYTDSTGKTRSYSTQKPKELYKRIILASTKANAMVLDPFCGLSTTLVAAELENRQWVGIDFWNKAFKVLKDRLKQEGLIGTGVNSDGLKRIRFNELTLVKRQLKRTDKGHEAVGRLKTPTTVIRREPEGRKMSHREMKDQLIKDYGGARCLGCNRAFDDDRYLELDHNTPRSDGGLNHISNRILLCGPCNKLKSNLHTLRWLQKENMKLGYWKD